MVSISAPRIKGILAIFVSAIIFGHTGFLERMIEPMWTDIGQPISKTGIALIILLVFLAFKRSKITFDKKDRAFIILMSVLIAIDGLFFTLSAININVAVTIFLFYIGTLSTTFILDKFVRKDPIQIIDTVVLSIAFLGLAFISLQSLTGGSNDLTIYHFLGLLAGCFDGGVHFIRNKISHVDKSNMLFWQVLGPVLFLSIIILVTRSSVIETFSFVSLAWSALYGVVFLVGMWLLNFGFTHIKSNEGAVILSSEVLFAAAASAIWLSEIPHTNEIIGGVIVFIASVARPIYEMITKRVE